MAINHGGKKIINILIEKLNYLPGNRAVYKPHVNYLLKTFNKSAMRAIDVAYVKENGKYYIVDGQHRVEVYKIKGEAYVPAIIHEVDTIKDAMHLARIFNDSKPMKTIEKLSLDILKGDAIAQDMWAAAKKAKFELLVPKHAPNSDDYHIKAAETVIQIYNNGERHETNYGNYHLTKVLQLIPLTWDRRLFSLCTQSSFMKGISHVFIQHPQINLKTFSNKIQSRIFGAKDERKCNGHPMAIFMKAKEYKRSSSSGWYKGVSAVLVDLYNYNNYKKNKIQIQIYDEIYPKFL